MSLASTQDAPAQTHARHAGGRRTPLAARGEPFVWLMGSALVLSVAMIVGLLALILANGLSAFWPAPLERVELRDGGVFVGSPAGREVFTPDPRQLEAIDSLRERGELPEGALAGDGRPVRVLFRVANREINGDTFRWVPLHAIASREREPSLAFVERTGWGAWMGEPRELLEYETVRVEPDADPPASPTPHADVELVRQADGGSRFFAVPRVVARGVEATWSALPEAVDRAHERLERRERLNAVTLADINRAIDDQRRRVRLAEIRLEDAQNPEPRGMPAALWALLVVGLGGSVAGVATARRWRPRLDPERRGVGRLASNALGAVALVLALAVSLEHPWAGGGGDLERARVELADVRAQADAARADLEERARSVVADIRELDAEDARYRVVFVDGAGVMAPVSDSRRDEPMRVSQVVRVVRPNDLGVPGKLGVYLARWWEYVSTDPREANTEGGVLPVLFGTVLLTVLLSIVVVPLGVVAALYLREYARQGLVTSVVRIAVNNLAGVPSIVYGVFGLGFFCYTVGGFIDGGPADPMARVGTLGDPGWWAWVVIGLLVVVSAMSLGVLARPTPGRPERGKHRLARAAMAALWLSAAGVVAVLFATTPYFEGFFRVQVADRTPVFGTPGLLWASLTLALLTLPVVIVATEEAIAAVPNSAREGSYGCGASKWQTVRRIVLPGAMPGIMTGAILAMARGAGEVAPLMLVGAVKSADSLPFSRHFPFLHPERSFMHLGFHIYDLGFQSPDAQTARPLVWTTTLLLIAVVVTMNLIAITIRARLRRRLSSGHF